MATDSADPADSSDSTGKRPWLAALLSVLYPGLGHVYLRLWGRALLWFLSIVTATALLVPPEAYPSTLSVGAAMEAAQALPLTVSLTILLMTLLNVLDAYMMAKRASKSGGDASEGGPTCPNCGKEVDEDLDFCQWCTTELE
ncbi:MAG: zinc ribbon domain-containing protein [Haloarculaceae archaeon]